MKLIYIIAQGHSGSTLTDCILGTHPDVVSSGELRYINWQLERTKGVHIGENSVIGAGSVVTKDIPENIIVAGNPCRVIREL